jgi:hypothetical protein
MRGYRIAVIAVLGVSVPVAAQAQFSLGLKAGASFATLSNKAPDWKSRTGFAGGVAFDFRAKVIGLQPEVLYVQKGVDFEGTSSASSDAPHISYIEVPVLVKVTIPTPAIEPMFYAGPSVMFRLQCRANDTDCGDQTKSTDYGAVLGAGLRFGGARGFTVEGRYTWGLQNIHDPDAGVKNNTRTFLLLAGVSL